MILSKWLATLLGGALAVQGALAIDLNIDDEGMWFSHCLSHSLPNLTMSRFSFLKKCRQNRRHYDDGIL
jgi:hypothetical protein